MNNDQWSSGQFMYMCKLNIYIYFFFQLGRPLSGSPAPETYRPTGHCPNARMASPPLVFQQIFLSFFLLLSLGFPRLALVGLAPTFCVSQVYPTCEPHGALGEKSQYPCSSGSPILRALLMSCFPFCPKTTCKPAHQNRKLKVYRGTMKALIKWFYGILRDGQQVKRDKESGRNKIINFNESENAQYM